MARVYPNLLIQKCFSVSCRSCQHAIIGARLICLECWDPEGECGVRDTVNFCSRLACRTWVGRSSQNRAHTAAHQIFLEVRSYLHLNDTPWLLRRAREAVVGYRDKTRDSQAQHIVRTRQTNIPGRNHAPTILPRQISTEDINTPRGDDSTPSSQTMPPPGVDGNAQEATCSICRNAAKFPSWLCLECCKDGACCRLLH